MGLGRVKTFHPKRLDAVLTVSAQQVSVSSIFLI